MPDGADGDAAHPTSTGALRHDAAAPALLLPERIARGVKDTRLLRGMHFHAHRAAGSELLALSCRTQPDPARPGHRERVEPDVAR